jgi:hypothetical protein
MNFDMFEIFSKRLTFQNHIIGILKCAWDQLPHIKNIHLETISRSMVLLSELISPYASAIMVARTCNSISAYSNLKGSMLAASHFEA